MIALMLAALSWAVPTLTAEDETEPPTHALIEELDADADSDCHCDGEEDCTGDCDDCDVDEDCEDCDDEDCTCEEDHCEPEEETPHCGGGCH